jgi:hypothetical protein
MFSNEINRYLIPRRRDRQGGGAGRSVNLQVHPSEDPDRQKSVAGRALSDAAEALNAGRPGT